MCCAGNTDAKNVAEDVAHIKNIYAIISLLSTIGLLQYCYVTGRKDDAMRQDRIIPDSRMPYWLIVSFVVAALNLGAFLFLMYGLYDITQLVMLGLAGNIFLCAIAVIKTKTIGPRLSLISLAIVLSAALVYARAIYWAAGITW